MSNATIFVQIAAYRDPQLLPTLRDCVARAGHPDRLRFGICWQHDGSEHLAEFSRDKRVRLKEVAYPLARGTCWARQQTQQLYRDETYTLQIDSHHRFVNNWDLLAIEMLEGLRARGHAKPLLTSYAPPFEPDNDPDGRQQTPLRLRFDGFRPEGPFAVMPEAIPDSDRLQAPQPTRFFSAHLAFARGSFCREVPYDPNLYFFGEEPALALRAFTHGYDLFHPHRVLLWHYYGRGSAPRHWADHRRWAFRNARSLERYRMLVEEGLRSAEPRAAALAGHGLGTRRSLMDYSDWSGLCFRTRTASAAAWRGDPPGHHPGS